MTDLAFEAEALAPPVSAHDVRELLESYRESARTEPDKGTYFERLAIAYLTHDPIQMEQFQDAKSYAEWARANHWDTRDIGIDLVAKLRDQEGYAAIQCKFYDPAHKITKNDIDSFISASGKEPFKRRVIIDTTELPWSENAETMLRGQSRQRVKSDKASGIVNDANRYAVETVGNPAYPLELFQRVITVSLETLKIVRSLPKLELPV
jgi:predicted helicase